MESQFEMLKLAWPKDYVAEEEEEEDEEEEDDSDLSSDDIVVNHLRFKYESETEPEWDVDSYDGREHETDSDEREYYPDEEDYNDFLRRRREALGFSPDYYLGIQPFGNLDAPWGENMTIRDFLTELANLCVDKLNEDKGKSVEIDSIVSATVTGGAAWKIYITLMAREYENGPLIVYQAKVMSYAANYKPPFPILCRPAPKPSI